MSEYEPKTLKKAYNKMEHGSARIAAMRGAIQAADQQVDHPFRIFFRLDLCRESNFYDDSMDMMVVFPEVLAIIDKYPDTPSTVFNSNFKDSMAHILWVYKWILSSCTSFYQIPMEDCLKFYEDFKRRSLAYGYNLRPYYKCKYGFYFHIDRAAAEEAFHAFEELPRDANSDCKACERNTVINFYLRTDQPKRAAELSEEIENFSLTCGGGRMRAWLNMKENYMDYYLRKREFEEAEKYCRLIDPNRIRNDEFGAWDDFLYCYAYRNIGKALKIYKNNWKDWEEERCPWSIFEISLNNIRFFQELGRVRKRKTVKLPLDRSFPLYQESGQYSIEEICQYYYNRAGKMADCFDRRNGSQACQHMLREAVEYAK